MESNRILMWFSCGAASAVAAKLSVDMYENVEILYCDTSKYEHPDNIRFMMDVEAWIDRPIKILRSKRYKDIYDVFRKTRFLNGPSGARCTTELKRNVRKMYQTVDDTHVFGFTSDESKRYSDFLLRNPELKVLNPLGDAGITKRGCYKIIKDAGIDLPMMYKLGYKNNNCIGCVKGGKGYWNKIRVDFPDTFAKMAALERELNFSLNDKFLDEMGPTEGQYKPDHMECGVIC